MAQHEDEQNDETEMWREIHRRQQEHKAVKRQTNTEKFNAIDFASHGITVQKRTEFHYSLFCTKKGLTVRIDYFPTSEKYHIVTIDKRGKIKPENLLNLFR